MIVDDISSFSRKSPKVARLNFTGQKGLVHRGVRSSVGVTFFVKKMSLLMSRQPYRVPLQCCRGKGGTLCVVSNAGCFA